MDLKLHLILSVPLYSRGMYHPLFVPASFPSSQSDSLVISLFCACHPYNFPHIGQLSQPLSMKVIPAFSSHVLLLPKYEAVIYYQVLKNKKCFQHPFKTCKQLDN